MNKFKEFGLSENLLKIIEKLGIKVPTKIQVQTIPHIIKGKDVIGESETGSGKTLAFGCGIVEQVEKGQGLQALVLTPTRELAEQVKQSLISISEHKSLKVISVYGGVSIDPQIRDLMNSEVVVATPGRFLDHYQRRTINMSKVKILVLDEADRMLDMGFMDDVERIIQSCPKKRQTMFFSATILPIIIRLSKKYMVDPIKVSAGRYVDPSKLKQVYYDVSKNLKLSLLIHLLRHDKSGLCMVFCNTKSTVDFVAKNLVANEVEAVAIHGGFTQNKRSKTMEQFNKNKYHVLVCTDVAARGLHIDNVSHVYNYEVPRDPTDYVHRIGRTARAGLNGKVVNLLCNLDFDNFNKVLRDNSSFNVDKVDLPEMGKILPVASSKTPRRGNFKPGGRRPDGRGFHGRSQNRRPRGRF